MDFCFFHFVNYEYFAFVRIGVDNDGHSAAVDSSLLDYCFHSHHDFVTWAYLVHIVVDKKDNDGADMACNDSREGNFHNFGYSLGWGYDKVGDEDVVQDVADDEGYYAVDDNLVDYNYGSFLIACTFSCCNCL